MKKAVFRILNYFKAVCLLILLICIPRQMCAQQTTADSLLKALKSAPEDTSTVNLLNNLFKEYQNDDPTKALKYSKQALELAAKLGFQRGIASSYNNIGFACFNNGNTNDALDNYLKALEIF
ncbi:MAG: tetratricopeptide repeat protein, partial [Bacteroidales bacterium]